MAMSLFYLAAGSCMYFLFLKPARLLDGEKIKAELLYKEGTPLKKKAAKSNA